MRIFGGLTLRTPICGGQSESDYRWAGDWLHRRPTGHAMPASNPTQRSALLPKHPRPDRTPRRIRRSLAEYRKLASDHQEEMQRWKADATAAIRAVQALHKKTERDRKHHRRPDARKQAATRKRARHRECRHHPLDTLGGECPILARCVDAVGARSVGLYPPVR